MTIIAKTGWPVVTLILRYASGYAATQMREIRRYCDGIIGEAAGGGIVGSGETLYKM